ncbi:MAG: endolytic transglycosylase MltG [Porticoccaceae bacterium]|nr:endolytic transglycosylase MltG [Porticoccaceae bacterium]MBT5578663.1 endolytic transglycosylase MltG [Porticoccaceae bacterium]
MTKFLTGLSVALIALLTAVVVLLSSMGQHLDRPVNLVGQQDLDANNRLKWTIETGSNLSEVNRRLFNRGILSKPKLMARYAKLNNRASIRAGSYWITADDSARSLLDKFNRGEVIQYQITFPEGWSFEQWQAQFDAVPQFAAESKQAVADLLEEAGVNVDHPEGWFFPDTYSYTSTDSRADILRRAHKKMRLELEQAWQGRDDNLPYSSAYDALIMASIIEKETGLAAERDEIAGVFIRRLKTNMRLQTDPTVIYGLGDEYQGDIRRSHLKQRTAYNTYMINGLPPTPIAMPSAAAIDAALHPKPGSSLYFVARGDGGHYFSDSLEEHLRAVKKYQINQRVQNYQSAPKALSESRK